MIVIAGLSIGQLAAKAEINASTLRYYESVGFPPPPERKNGQCRYRKVGDFDRNKTSYN
ncbi:MerR family DNA-binding transcriptional regulator [Paenibacillus paeoniae]|uniref:helix-turn-helix domain-containing protein n=1 Tax=Paenibacillus paeoniae TaxID=2292705 RepID=UPI001F0C59B8|nr:MerR family DNA-binding transcriptional regulator [Paenibacillus paeoniae]